MPWKYCQFEWRVVWVDVLCVRLDCAGEQRVMGNIHAWVSGTGCILSWRRDIQGLKQAHVKASPIYMVVPEEIP